MKTPLPDGGGKRLRHLAATRLTDGKVTVDLGQVRDGTCLGDDAAEVIGRSVLVAMSNQVVSAAAFVELDGLVRRLVIAPPDLKPGDLPALMDDAEVDVVVTDETHAYRSAAAIAPFDLPVRTTARRIPPAIDTEWVLATSGTSGRPKLVAHTLAALTGAIGTAPPPGAPPRVWATFYDIRRYGGLQIFLRAILGGTDLVVSRPGEPIDAHLRRLGAAEVSSISGTPSHWRRVLMSDAGGAIAPDYIRLSGEIADQMVLDALRTAYPHAAIGHAYASTEAGVGFAVDDGLEGFPARLVDGAAAAAGDLDMKVVDGSLRIRSRRTASRYLGSAAPALTDPAGYVDTGDLVERRGDRYHFVGRRGGIINVGGLKVNPEEVEATINSHRDVRMSLVKARRNPLTGAVAVADIVLREPDAASDVLKAEILDLCRAQLPAYKVPALVRFVPALALTPAGKLSRDPAQAVHHA